MHAALQALLPGAHGDAVAAAAASEVAVVASEVAAVVASEVAALLAAAVSEVAAAAAVAVAGFLVAAVVVSSEAVAEDVFFSAFVVAFAVFAVAVAAVAAAAADPSATARTTSRPETGKTKIEPLFCQDFQRLRRYHHSGQREEEDTALFSSINAHTFPHLQQYYFPRETPCTARFHHRPSFSLTCFLHTENCTKLLSSPPHL